jgi:hypothetical protein
VKIVVINEINGKFICWMSSIVRVRINGTLELMRACILFINQILGIIMFPKISLWRPKSILFWINKNLKKQEAQRCQKPAPNEKKHTCPSIIFGLKCLLWTRSSGEMNAVIFLWHNQNFVYLYTLDIIPGCTWVHNWTVMVIHRGRI